MRTKAKVIVNGNMDRSKLDSKILEQLLRADIIAESNVVPSAVRENRALMRHKVSLVKMRAIIKNKLRVIMDKYVDYNTKELSTTSRILSKTLVM